MPLRPASDKTVYKAEGDTVDKVVVNLSQNKKIKKIPHIHYAALSRMKKLEDLYILNLNAAAMDLDEQVTCTEEMQRLQTEATIMFLCIKLAQAKSESHSTM